MSGFSLVMLLDTARCQIAAGSGGACAAGQRGMLVRVRKAMPLSVYLGDGSQVLSFFSVVRSRWCDKEPRACTSLQTLGRVRWP